MQVLDLNSSIMFQGVYINIYKTFTESYKNTMEFKDYYRILQVETQASQDDIRQAYRRLVQKFHPDINPAVDAEEKFKEIQEAYDTLKDVQKRTFYNYSYKTIKPYTYDWMRTKIQGWWYVYAQNRARRQATARAHAQRHNQSSLPFLLLGSGVLLLLITLVSGILIFQGTDVVQNESPTELTVIQENQIVTDILKGDPEGIEQLQNLPLTAQTTLFQQTGVKHAVINFFINHGENDVITALKGFDISLQEKIFKKDEAIKRLLMAHYYGLADKHIEGENFIQAFQLLDNLDSYLKDLPGFAIKYEAVQTQKNERLAELIAQYQQCLTRSERPLLEKTPCFEQTRQNIARIEPVHPILIEPNLNAIYATAVEQALTEKALEQAEQLIATWQKLFPQQVEQQQIFQQKLTLQRQFEKMVTALTGGDNKEIAQNLGYLKTVEKPVQEEVLKNPKIRENLLNFHMKELLTLMQLADKPVQPYLQLIEQFDSKTPTVEITHEKTPDTPVIKNKIMVLLKQCEEYYRVKRLTKGEQTALSCYKEVLARDPQNVAALAGLEKIEHLFQTWAENALHRSELSKATYYLLGLEKVNPQSAMLGDLKKQMHWKRRQQIKQSPPQEPKDNQPKDNQPSAPVRPPVKQKQQVIATESQPVPRRQKSPPVIKKTEVQVKTEQNVVPQCVGCSCADLLRQLSMSVRPLTASQQAFLTQCY